MIPEQRRRPSINPPGNVEANDLTPAMAIGIAKVWKQSIPGYEWRSAKVNRYTG
jgi:hypothetical protein